MAILSQDVIRNDNGTSTVANTTYSRGYASQNFTETVWGSYIPLSEGYRAVDGAVIWAGDPFVADERHMVQRIADGGLMSIQYRTWNVKRACAFALGYRLNPNGAKPKVRRVWVGGSLAYSEGDSMPVKYSNFQQQYIPNGQWVNGVWVPNSSENTYGNTFGDVFYSFKAASSDGKPAGYVQWDEDGNMLGQNPVKATIKFRFYDGSEDQEPDQTILAALGSDAPSFRGMMYLVIDDLLVGQGSEHTNIFAAGVNANGPTSTGGQRVDGTFPTIRVELVDGAASVVYRGQFQPTSGADRVHQGLFVAANWDTSELISLAPVSTGGCYLHRYDIDNKAETYSKFVPGFPDERIGHDHLLWDTVNDFLFTASIFEESRDKITMRTDGTIIDSGLRSGITPSNGDPWTEQNPSDRSEHWSCADLGYMVVNGELRTIACGHGYSGAGAAIYLRKDGTFSHLIYPRQAFNIPETQAFSSGIMKALPLWVHATQDQHLSYQDVCFVHCYGDVHSDAPGGVRLIYVGMDSDNVPRIRGIQNIITGTHNGGSYAAVLDVAGNIIVQEGLEDKVTKFTIDYLGDPDYSIAPGWRGLFPRITGTQVKTFAAASTPNLGNVTFANVTNNVVYSGARYLDMGTMQTSVVGDSSYNFTGLWDSTRGTMFFTGSMDAPLSGKGMLWATIISGLLGNIGTLGGVLQDIAVAAGYEVGDLNIDGSLTTGVPGVLITQPTDLGTLFNNLGVIYEFGYFNSGGKLTFRKSSNSPVYSTGYVQTVAPASSHINVQDGDTITIGTITYRFKATPSAPFDVKLGVDTSVVKPDGFLRSLCNLFAAIKGDSTLGADEVPFFAGTVVNQGVTAKFDAQSAVSDTNGQMLGYSKIVLTATVGGTAGNAVALASSAPTRMQVSGAQLVGGEEVAAPGVSITLDQMCLVGENQITETDAIITSIPPPGASQTAASVTYYALEQDYQRATQTFTPDNLGGALPDATTTVPYDLPIVMSTSEAYSRVSHVGFAAGSMTITQEFRLPQAYIGIEPNDVLSVIVPPFAYTVRVDEATFNGDFSMSISATNFDARTDVPINNSDSRANIPQSVPSAGDALPLFMDAPLLDILGGTIPGVIDVRLGLRPYFSSFRSAVFSMGEGSEDPDQLFTTTEPVKWGRLAEEMPTFNYPGYTVEEDSITVVCRSLNPDRDLQSATDEISFIAGENCVAIGSGTTWEYVFFRDVELVSSGVVRLTGLIRAQRGTDYAAASHTINDLVVLVASANPTFKSGTRAQSFTAEKAGTSYTLVGTGSPTSKPPYTEVDVLRGYNLYPFSPAHFSATLAGGNDIDLAWVRRDRLSDEFVTEAPPMSETSELYDLEIMDGSTVVRTLQDLSSPAYTYTSTQQTADGFSPPLANIKFRVYQKGELGRGFPHEETVNVD